MKANRPNDSAAPLDGLLREWTVSASLPPRFQDRVWRRVALAEASPAPGGWAGPWLARVQSFLARPALAAGYVTALLVLGFTMGWATGVEKSARVDQHLSARYVQVLDPYQHPRH